MPQLPVEFYRRKDVFAISRELLGKVLITKIACPLFPKPVITAGIIVETEAYFGPEDRASHAFNNRRTTRTETMFGAGGRAYVYLCYGIHNLFNVVTGPLDMPHGVLIRGIEPCDGLDYMLKRRNFATMKPALAAGPGALSKALGITTSHNGVDLCGNQIWIEETGYRIDAGEIQTAPRVGVAYAAEYALKPWRFYIRGNPWVSRPVAH